MPEEMTSAEVRSKLVESLRLDLVGPGVNLGDAQEVLPQAPSRWYLTGFLVPLGAKPEQRADEAADDDFDDAGEAVGTDDDAAEDKPAARPRFFPSSIGASVLVPAVAKSLRVCVRWGDYRRKPEPPEEWERTPREELVEVDLTKATDRPLEDKVPNSDGLMVAYLSRPVGLLAVGSDVPEGARTVSIFVVNRRAEAPDITRDEAFAFQVHLEISGDTAFLRRPDLRGLSSDDWDERVADLQYRDEGEYSVGHNVATEAVHDDGVCCKVVRTCWIPDAEVEKVEPAKIPGVEISMDALASLKDGEDAKEKLGPLVVEYRKWIQTEADQVPKAPAKRYETGQELVTRAKVAAIRIESGIALLATPDCLEAFRIANKCMAEAARRRMGVMQDKPPEDVKPQWRPFQLAFILMNLRAIAEPGSDDRDVVDLLFFPTGGGKTEAYLGLAAFTLVLRRLRNPGVTSAGLSVLMRYTLRLLTFEQLSRAATLICALELERQSDADKLGDWPFEIGLWVGRAATPNRIGKKGDKDQNCARERTIRFLNDDRKPSPIPLEECPWCGTKFSKLSFRLIPNSDNPQDLRVSCINRECKFTRGTPLPILAVDEPIYRRLPCFLIATVDKFAALPWTGEVGAFFGRVERGDKDGFYGPCDHAKGNNLPVPRLLPPDLVIQDELHLISGPLGTIVGLYESALDELCVAEKDGKTIRPKIVASTATVRKAETQIRALFNRSFVDIFPPPGPDRRDSFFAETLPASERNARLYVGIAAQGRSPKVAMLRVYLALLGAGQKWHNKIRKKGELASAADPYLTLLGYFNSLRELGGARRLVEDEVRNRLAGYGGRKRVGEEAGLFEDRRIGYEPVELTSRVDTAHVSEAKRRLALPFGDEKRVDVAIATNMISVGLDITRLGLMVVFGQPKGSAEYIQATSRVGRDADRPGLVVTIFNVHKPRDRSHYERFAAYHETFYRSVEATSVTPFSPRALDKGLAAAFVGLVRHGHRPMTPPLGAMDVLKERARLDFAVNALSERARRHSKDLMPEELERLRLRVRDRCLDLLDSWAREAQDYQQSGVALQYNPQETGAAKQLLYDFLSPELKNLPPTNRKMKFRANRSMRDVEPAVNVWVKTLDNVDLEDDPL
jgi:Helicase conserved C-terminal domain